MPNRSKVRQDVGRAYEALMALARALADIAATLWRGAFAFGERQAVAVRAENEAKKKGPRF